MRRKVGEGERKQTADSDKVLPLYVRAEPGKVSAAKRAIEKTGREIRSVDAGYIAVDLPPKSTLTIAESDAVRHIQERHTPRAHQVPERNISEGVGVMHADTLHDEGVTGDGARIAVIDHRFHTDNPKYSDRIVATVGDSTYFTSDSEYNDTSYEGPTEQHGTACAELVADVAPDAELVLATTIGPQSFGQIMNEIESYDPDGATMSLGYYTGLRIDGEDPISSRIDQFTDGGRLFANSAGNEANAHWDGQFENDGNDLMVFDSSLSTPTRFPVEMPYSGSEIHVHWDADWSQDDQRYKVRVYDNEDDPVGDSSALLTEQTTDPVEIISAPSSGSNPYHLEIEKVDATGDEHFDMFTWYSSLGRTTARRSIGIPATSPDENLLSVAAVQATEYGRTSEEHLKPYSSQGPTQDGRRGIDIAAPSMVSTTDEGEYGAYGALEDGGGFNGTSAASPHVGGAFGLLFGSAISASPVQARDALFDTGRSIVDSDVAEPGENNTKIGHGYTDVAAAQEWSTSIHATGDVISPGERATITAAGSDIENITVADLWTDWSVDSTQPDGGTFSDDVASAGTGSFSWDSTQSSVSVSLTVDVPSRYVGGTYVVDVIGQKSGSPVEKTVQIDIS
ncbi:S8 family serine peptidase [Halorhabdus utahensis]|uniref:S8 family serine peptidase n=1 Tax=Halorhabdus utahensis TaxID=146826 RepID=UPI0006780277|nr:S8 family serine peptidase [Halorhabdus utahensis]